MYNRKRTVSSISGAGKTRQTYKRVKLDPYPTPYTNIKCKNIECKDLNLKPETVKLLEENIAGKLLDIGLSDYFLDLTSKVKTTEAKVNKWDVKLKNSVCKGKHQQK